MHSDRFRVGFAGRLVVEKGLDVLVKALALMDGERELVVAGDGPMRAWLHEQNLGGATLRLLSGLSHDEMPTAYAQMDVLVLPSRSTPTWVEQFGRVLVEAVSCGAPVIGSCSGEIPWVIEATGAGRVFPEGDWAALCGILEELRDDKVERERLVSKGAARVQELFSVSAVASELSLVLQRALPPS
jgi:glycosyltransferase involved in cell wall biosynthesis